MIVKTVNRGPSAEDVNCEPHSSLSHDSMIYFQRFHSNTRPTESEKRSSHRRILLNYKINNRGSMNRHKAALIEVAPDSHVYTSAHRLLLPT